jgi:ATP synthase protein I
MKSDTPNEPSELEKEVSSKAARKLWAQRQNKRSFWEGFSVFGLVGWSVAIPTLMGVGLGIWLDKHYPVEHSWTLSLLVAGIILGCFNAWYWIDKENKAIDKDLNNDE